MKAQKIVFFSHDSYLFGASRSMVDLAAHVMQDANYEVEIVLPYEGPLSTLIKEKGMSYSIVPSEKVVSSSYEKKNKWKKLSNNIGFYRLHFAFYRRSKPDIVIFNTSTNYFPIFLYNLLGCKCVLYLREFGKADYGLSHDFGGFFFKNALKISKLVISNSFAIRNYYLAEYNRDSVVVYNGICDKKEFDRRYSLKHEISSPARSAFVFGIVGSIMDNLGKGHDIALSAMKIVSIIHPSAELHIYGAGSYEKQFVAMVNAEGLEKVVLMKGFVKDLDEIYTQIDCLLMCSRWEAFGRVTVEALSYGVPVIGLDNAGTKELIHNDNGLLFDGTPEQLADQMLYMMSMKQNNSLEIWRNAKRDFSNEVYYANFIKSLIF